MIKEATALASAGFKVDVYGAWFDPNLKARDQQLTANAHFSFSPVIDLTKGGFSSRASRLGYRLRSKFGQLASQYARVENQWQLGYAISALNRAVKRNVANMYIAHSEAALVASHRLLRAGHRVGLDMEDWFSEDLLPAAREFRPVSLLRTMELEILRRAAHSSCTSRAMSAALVTEYGCHPPAVLYNAFEWAERRFLDGKFKDRINLDVPSIHWYSQTLGHGRGLEDLFAALPHVKYKAEIHLRGRPEPGFDDWVARQAPPEWLSRIFIHNLVSNNELLSRIAEHDIGFAGEMKFCRSRDLTVTNKILHYLLGGLAVVASDTTGQREIMEQAKDAVLIYPSGNPHVLAERLNSLLTSPEKLGIAKAAALRAAEQTFCWERQIPTLLRTVENALCI